MIARIKAHYLAGGITSIHHHPGNPVTGSLSRDTTIASGTTGTVYDLTNDPITSVLPGGSERTQYLAYVARIVAFLNDLVDDDGVRIPVILRWFHENNGTFFWFGGDTVKSEQLFQDFVDRLRDAGVVNVLIDYNVTLNSSPTYSNYIPAAGYFDFNSGDYYDSAGTPAGMSGAATQFLALFAVATRPMMFSEVGFENAASTDATLWNTKMGIYHRDRFSLSAGFTTWDDPYGPAAGSANSADVTALTDLAACITRENISGVYTRTTAYVPDTTTPVLSGPIDGANGTTAGTLGVTTDSGNGTLYWFVSTSATPPSAAALKAGTGASAFGNQSVLTSGTQAVAVTGLSASTGYYAHFLHRDAAGNDSAIASGDGFTTATPDTTAPTLSSPTDAANGETGGTLAVTTNEGNGTLFWFVSTSATPPTGVNLKAGTGAVASGSQAVSGTGAQNVNATGLTAATAYFSYFLHTDASANDSSVASADGFTTDAAASWAPTDFGAALKGWFKADDNTTVFSNTGTTQAVAGSSTVRQWNDKSGNGYHLGEATAKPTYVTDGLNSKKAVKFTSASAQHLQVVGSALANVATGGDVAHTIIFAARRGTPGASNTLFSFYSSTVSRFFRTSFSSTDTVEYNRYDGTTTTTGASSAVATADVWYVVTMVFSGTTLSVWVDGVEVASAVACNSASITVNSFVVGANNNFTTPWGTPFNGAMGEILITSETSRTADVIAAEAYLAGEWQ